MLTKNKDSEEVKQKVAVFREKRALEKAHKKQEAQKQAAELQRQREVKKEQEKQEILTLLSKVVEVDNVNHTTYEFNEVKANKRFFEMLVNTVFEKNEHGITFLSCEFDKTRNKEIKGYLVATNKRVWFVAKNIDFQQKFRYQTIKDLKSFNDGTFEKGLKIQYGVKKLEFDEISDSEQMQRFKKMILEYVSHIVS